MQDNIPWGILDLESDRSRFENWTCPLLGMQLKRPLDFSEPQFPCLKVGNISTIIFQKLHVKICEAQC